MPRKGTVQIMEKSQVLFSRPLILVEKGVSGYRSVINLKKVNQNILYVYFRQEDLSFLKKHVQK